MKNIAKAINDVAKNIKGIEKDMTVGSGSYSYKGVSDKDVKTIVGRAMQEHGLSILPIGVDSKTQIDRWEENGKQRQQVFAEVVTRYLLLHESGETIELTGYGHGVDTQDKAAGKATTYAMKYTLLYTFLVATGKIDDADGTHSEEIPVARKQKESLNPKHEKWSDAKKALMQGNVTIEAIKKKYSLTPENEKQLIA